MSYEKKSIANIIDDIDSHRILLPSIQRKYVWEEEQIAKLMDSIMCGYPFGTFLFWKVKKKVINEQRYPLYEFIKDYHELTMFKNPHAAQPFSVAPDSLNDTICAVLDGQQRLTSLYISLKGSLSKKLPKKRWNNPDAFPTKELYFNLLSEKQNEEDDITYEFQFFTKEEAAQPTEEGKIWYKVKDVLQYLGQGDLNRMVMQSGWGDNDVIVDNIMRLYQRLKVDELINYFEVASDAMDAVLDIFVRVNSGGTVLSKTDLLFSTIVAYWPSARDEIDNLLAEVNGIGDRYEFNSDFIMRSCLYVLNMPILMKVESFRQDNIDMIKTQWSKIRATIKDTVRLLNELGFSSENIVSNNAILPIIYYRFHAGPKALEDTEVKENIRKYFVLAQVKKVFSGHTNQTLDIFRNALKKLKKFDFDALKNIPLSYGNVLACSTDDIEKWLTDFKKGPYTFLLLSLLYPDLKYGQEKFEQDHLHPDSYFREGTLKKLVLEDGKKLTDDDIIDWINKSATLPNLQFLTSHDNEQRRATPLGDWIKSNTPRFLPKQKDYNLESFSEFYDARKKLLAKKFKQMLV